MRILRIIEKLEKVNEALTIYNPDVHGLTQKDDLEKMRNELYKELSHIGSEAYREQQERWNIFKIVLSIILFLILLTFSGCWGYPEYNVWSQSKYGEAELKKAEWNRQISIREAEAKYHSSIQLANAEIERAKGVAAANKIIGDSLNNNESYLRYLWINNLEKNKNNQVIYVPSDAGLPILEAGRLKK